MKIDNATQLRAIAQRRWRGRPSFPALRRTTQSRLPRCVWMYKEQTSCAVVVGNHSVRLAGARSRSQRNEAMLLITRHLTRTVVLLGLVGCGTGTRPTADGGGSDAAAYTDVIRPPNSRYCPLFDGTDGGVLRLNADGTPTTNLGAWPILCHPNMRPGDPCVGPQGSPGVCVDFDYESSGRFPGFTSANRVALYCRHPLEDPCAEVASSAGMITTSESCESWGNCVRVPNPLPGRRQFVCFPPVCN